MEEKTSTPDFQSHLAQIKNNLKSWTSFEWIFFWAVIPGLLFIIYALPQSIKNDFFILNTANLWGLSAYFLFAYTHSELFWHLIGNVAFYLVTLGVIFAFENNKQRFWIMCLSAFLLVPFITAILTILFFQILGIAGTSQGFSAIDGAFLAYAIFIVIIGIIQEGFGRFDHPELFEGKKILYYTSLLLSCIMLGLIGIIGIIFGQFVNPGGQIVNGLAHFGGFITGLIVLLLYDVTKEKRRIFQMILTIVIVMGVIWYVNYLLKFLISP